MNEQTNGALARWLGWHLKHERFWATNDKQLTGYHNDTDPNNQLYYFNPMQRIDHAWLLVEHMRDTATRTKHRKFCRELVRIVKEQLTIEQTARAICEAVIEIAGIEV